MAVSTLRCKEGNGDGYFVGRLLILGFSVQGFRGTVFAHIRAWAFLVLFGSFFGPFLCANNSMYMYVYIRMNNLRLEGV